MDLGYTTTLAMVAICAVSSQAVTVNPCPTNKIAPHRRIASWDQGQPRTFGGAFYDLLRPNNQQNVQGSLLEEPQKDDPDDCGDIEDYDENDISSILSPQRRQGSYGRLFFSGLFNNPPQYGQQPDQPLGPNRPQNRPPNRPPIRPQSPSHPPTRPPYASGGYFDNNHYRPPPQQYPSDNVKPVHDGVYETQMTYRPEVVGGPIGHVVGVSPVRPTRRPIIEDIDTPQRAPNYVNFPTRPATQVPDYTTTRRPKPRNLNYSNNVLGSFVDLLFK